MIEVLGGLLDVAPGALLVVGLIFARVSGAVSLLPGFGESAVPMRLKLGIAIAFTAILATTVWERFEQAPVPRFWALAILTETVIGLVLGISLRLMVIALQIAGSVASQTISLAQIFGAGLGADPQPAFSSLLVIAGLALAMMMGLHVQIVNLFVVSYDLFPLGGLPRAEHLSQWGASHVGRMFALGLSLAAPFVIAATIYNLSLGFVSKAMPQLMVAFVGAPAISMVGLLLFMFASPLMLTAWMQIFADQIQSPDLGFR